jgi:hypothetical protein
MVPKPSRALATPTRIGPGNPGAFSEGFGGEEGQSKLAENSRENAAAVMLLSACGSFIEAT